ncbi:DUF373 family protein [Fervidicoccus fontis]|uniref:Membrane protein n=2 Tax=Fervidicoccus fontis TaxID=683846 RepID=I0A2H6_FERFK|nr:DUF373 family protein [Fervidicoccus fontis]AFH43183.1 membrane protein [Fervidicoccus fontis Kam940]MBE9390563.1 DUF373 family protein [Fervidicoccus fontis]
MEKGKVLLLVVDRDNDIERVTGKSTPIFGKDDVFKIAVEFALKSPEDSDLNVMFSALQLYEKLRNEGMDVEIAVVGGHETDSIKADMKIRDAVKFLKEKTGVTGIIMVSDGTEDELTLPVIETILPVISIKRVVVEQWRGVEETYILIGKYLKKAIFEPRFSKIFLGLPGAIILAFVILDFFGYIQYGVMVAGFLIGGAMIIRGFNLESKIYELWASSPIMFISSTIATIFLISGAVIFGYTLYSEYNIRSWGEALQSATPLIGLSIFSIYIGKGIVKIIERNIRIWRDVLGMIVTLIFIIAFLRLGQYLTTYPGGTALDILRSSLFDSGFLEILLVGLVIAGALTLIIAYLEKRFFPSQK